MGTRGLAPPTGQGPTQKISAPLSSISSRGQPRDLGAPLPSLRPSGTPGGGDVSRRPRDAADVVAARGSRDTSGEGANTTGRGAASRRSRSLATPLLDRGASGGDLGGCPGDGAVARGGDEEACFGPWGGGGDVAADGGRGARRGSGGADGVVRRGPDRRADAPRRRPRS